MIEFDRVTITYDGAPEPVLSDVTLAIDEGELCLVVGRTGSGKSTLLGAVNGLVPHFTGGTLAGHVKVDGRDTADYPPRELADLVGVVLQDPLAGFVTDTVEEELAYGMEQLALAPETMRKRVEETLDLLGLAELRASPLRELSGGQQQRVAIGAVLTAHPRVLVLDEPTSSLDPTAAEEVLAAITRLVHDLGLTVLVAEHRLERVAQYADRVVSLPGDGSVTDGPAAPVLETADVRPPVVTLAQLADWSPPPLSVRDARRLAGPLRERLAAHPPAPSHRSATTGGEALRSRGIVVRYGQTVAVAGVDLDLAAGEVTGLMGRNGSGKSSLLWALQGSGRRQSGRVEVDGHDPRRISAADARTLVGLVPADRVGPAVPDHGGSRARAGRPRVRGVRLVPGRRTPGPTRARHRPPRQPARPLRRTAPESRARDPVARRPPRGAARRAHPRPGLRRQARARRDHRWAGPRGQGGRDLPPTTSSSPPRPPIAWS